MTATVVLGPKTRLGRELVSRLHGEEVLAVARDAADAAEVTAVIGAGAEVVDGADDDLTARVATLGRGSGPVRLVVAALGPVHPDTPRTSYDAAAVERDLELVRQVLAAGRPTQVVLVSTILALAPGDDRRYYAGWKGVVEQQLQQLVDDRSAAGEPAELSVLYPGRLLADTERRGRLRLHTGYGALARAVLGIEPGRPVSRVVGADTRIWLLARSISFAIRSLAPSTSRSASLPPFGDAG